MNGSILVQNLGKSYKHWGREWRRVASWMFSSIQPREESWVLRNASFAVHPGEAIGIIGQNGAGKSTLLKLITGTIRPNEGVIQLQGKVSAILELGMGFNLDLTGRQNAYHSAGLMGHMQSDIALAMPGIEAFAEIGEYFDQPVRTYSSGMQMRVAFAVATAIRPDVLIVDEALSVGDVYFQQKCFRRIRQYSAEGTTLLFVTHDLSAVLEICTRAIYIRSGRIISDGPPQAAVDLYQADALLQVNAATITTTVNTSVMQDEPTEQSELPSTQSSVVGGTGSMVTKDVTCLSVCLLDINGAETTAILSENYATLDIRYKTHRDLSDPHVGFKIRNRLGSVIFETNTYCMGKQIGFTEKDTELKVCFNFPIDLAPGEYTITVGLANQGFDKGEFKEYLSYLHGVLLITVLPNEKAITWSGIINIRPTVDWAITSVSQLSMEHNV